MHLNRFFPWHFFVVLSCAMHGTASAHAAAPANNASWQDLGNGVVLETRTGLRWTKMDNGQDINWPDAQSYCARLGEGWRLPTTEELSGVVAFAERAGESAPCGDATCKSPPQLQLSSAWHWSGTAVTKKEARDYDELAWGVTMVNGRRTMGIQPSSYAARALCVQRP